MARGASEGRTRRGAATLVGVGLLAAAFVVFFASAAGAHAELETSVPAAGAQLSDSPSQVLLMFTEPPDPGLSSVELLDASGRAVTEGAVRAVAGHPTELRVPITTALGDGTYTVSWRAVSRDDGHVTAGSFSFGVGVPVPAGAPSTLEHEGSTPSPSALAVVGRWLFYAGLALLFGAAAVGGAIARRPLGRAWMLWAAWIVSAVGLIAMMLAERSVLEVSLVRLLASGTGAQFVGRGVALIVLAIAVAVASMRFDRPGLLVVGGVAAVAMLVHAVEGHAGAPSSVRTANVADEWLHLLAVGAWLGGLPWLLVATWHPGRHRPSATNVVVVAGNEPADDRPKGDGRHTPGGRGALAPAAVRTLGYSVVEARTVIAERDAAERAAVVLRFSRLATIALAVAVVTGVLRAITEVASVGQLVTTSFGVALLVKAGLVAALVALGAHNHFRRVPRADDERQIRLLRRTVKAEVAVGAAVLLAAAVLSQLPPASNVSAAEHDAGPAALVVAGHDFATTTRLRLTVSPGTLGTNTFTAEVTDYDTGAPVPAKSVRLEFSLPTRPDVAAAMLDLDHVSGAIWRGSGSPLSIYGTYSVRATLQEATSAVSVPLQLRPRLPAERVSVARASGQPTLYTVALAGGGSLQAYVEPASAGPNTVHFTFFQPSGSEMTITSATASVVPPGGAARPAKLIRFDPGHFAADVSLTPGRWTFIVSAATADGVHLHAYFAPTIA